MFETKTFAILCFFSHNISMELQIIHILQNGKNAFLDVFFQTFSFMASIWGFLILATILFLFFDYIFALFFSGTYGLAVGFNYILKYIINRPRPSQIDPSIINYDGNIGLSMPSGHMTSIIVMVIFVGFLIHLKCKNKNIRILSYICLAFTAFFVFLSRMYLGQHFISDLIVATIFATLFSILGILLYNKRRSIYEHLRNYNQKRNKEKLTKQEIEYVVNNFVNEKIDEEQMSRFLFAVMKNSLTTQETFYLTKAMQNSGQTFDLSKLGKTADKHSTGGVSDTTTLIVAPIVACTKIKMIKSSGRSLGHTGGTADKLESFEGYRTGLPYDIAMKLTNKNGACLITQTSEFAPADKKIYALRDKIGAVESLPLIASSIMSKKLASGNDIIVLDVKCGNGAFMKNLHDAQKLAKLMVKIGKADGKKMLAVISDMNQPLGYNIGNALEVIEAIDVLKGKKSLLGELSCFLAEKIIELGENVSAKKAELMVNEIIKSGKALEKFKTMISDSGGKTDLFDGFVPNVTTEIVSEKDGYVWGYMTQQLGEFASDIEKLQKNNGVVNYRQTGIITYKKIGDEVKKGDKLFGICGKVPNELVQKIALCAIIKKQKIKPVNLIKKVIR